jgi:tetratricopeptide (TPR) repeat protein
MTMKKYLCAAIGFCFVSAPMGLWAQSVPAKTQSFSMRPTPPASEPKSGQYQFGQFEQFEEMALDPEQSEPAWNENGGPVLATPQQAAEIDTARHLRQEGIVAFHTGHYATAEADARHSLALYAPDYLTRKLLAETLAAEGKNHEALQDYVILSSETWGMPRISLPYALLLLETGDWPHAVAVYENTGLVRPEAGRPNIEVTFSASQPNPTALAAAIHVAYGLALIDIVDRIDQPQPDRALAEFQRAVALEPSWAVVRYYYGYGLQKAGKPTQAKAAYQMAASMGSGNVKVDAEAAVKRL